MGNKVAGRRWGRDVEIIPLVLDKLNLKFQLEIPGELFRRQKKKKKSCLEKV